MFASPGNSIYHVLIFLVPFGICKEVVFPALFSGRPRDDVREVYPILAQNFQNLHQRAGFVCSGKHDGRLVLAGAFGSYRAYGGYPDVFSLGGGRWGRDTGSVGVFIDTGGKDHYLGKGRDGALWTQSRMYSWPMPVISPSTRRVLGVFPASSRLSE